MPNEQSDPLFQLIGRMSKSDKRFFKLMASRQEGGEGKFIRLFDRLEKMKTYDEQQLLRLEPSIARRQLPNLKAFLYDYLLRCLAFSNSSASPERIIASQIAQVQLLYDKCLYHDSSRLIEKAKRTAQQYEHSTQLPQLLELEKQVIHHTVTERHEQRVNDTVRHSQEVLRHIDRVGKFQNLAIRLNVFYVQNGFIRNKAELEKVQRFFRDNLPAYEEAKLVFEEKLQLYYALTGYYFFVQDFSNGYRYAKRWVELFNERPERIVNYMELYIRALNSLLAVLNKRNALAEFTEVHRMLVGLKRTGKYRLTENENLTLFKAIYIHEMNRHFMMGEFRSGTRIVARLENDLNRFIPLLDHHSVLLFYYKIACLYLGADQYKRALFWLSKIIGAKDISVREDLHAFARILALICHSELGNDRLAEAHIKSLFRFLSKKGELTAYHLLILEFLRKLHRNLSPRQLERLFRELKEKLQPLTRQRFEKRAFLYFDIISWLESKISGKPLELLIKENIQTR